MILTDILNELHNSDEYPLHMPGHKRDYSPDTLLSNAYGLDITEIEGYDNLYDAKGILREAMNRAAKLYNCPDTFYLVNGSTTGILTAIYSVTDQGDYIIVADNCHRSVHSAIELRELRVDYLRPDKLVKQDIDGGIRPVDVEDAVRRALDRGVKPAAVVITSPNYDGVISDVRAISDITHKAGIPLIVDEAHGAHLSLNDKLPKGAIELGADIVVHSTHKTLAAMTQTALLHVQGDLVDITKVNKYWHTFQTSSPSYVLMASIDTAIDNLFNMGEKLWENFFHNRDNFDRKTNGLRHLHILHFEDCAGRNDIVALDPCKITVTTDGIINGVSLQRILLDNYHLQIELASEERIIAIVTYADSEEGFNRFANALQEIDNRIEAGDTEGWISLTQASQAEGERRDLYAPCIPGQV